MGVHDLVSAPATATPDAVAIVAGDQQLSYCELDARADQLAHVLRSFGVEPDVPVGLCVERSLDLAIGALAILKAGGAYVPLDPSYPPNRLSTLLEESGASLLVAQSCVAKQLPVGRWRTIFLDADGLATADYLNTSPVTGTKPGNLAYIIFTSGSTGRPKGVQIAHASLLNLVSWHRNAFKVVRGDRATLQSSPGFDAAVWELWPYLAAGATVHVVDEAVRMIPERLRDWIVRNGITISFLPTALAERMIDLPWPQETALRVLLTGADTLHRYPRVDLPFALVNNYGPTECTVVATSGTIYPAASPEEFPSIGRPIENTQVHIVDEQLKPVQWPDKPRPDAHNFRGCIQKFSFPRSLSDHIKELSRRLSTTLFLVLLTDLATVLHRYSGQQEIILGTLSPSGRKRSEVMGLLGYFLNPVALRLGSTEV